MCWPGASGIEAGVTIDLELLNRVTYNPCNEIATIQPGARWSEVYSTLDERGLFDGRSFSTMADHSCCRWETSRWRT